MSLIIKNFDSIRYNKRVRVFFVLFLLVGIGVFAQMWHSKNTSTSQKVTVLPTVSLTPSERIDVSREFTQSVFVPYWTLNTSVNSEYSSVIYFGVAGTIDGIDKNDAGYRNIDEFMENTQHVDQRMLTVRMINTSDNSQILKDKNAQRKIIQESVKIAQQYNFDGIVLDFEMNALPFDAVLERVNAFYSAFYTDVKSENLTFYITLYGDTYFRVRPYDVEKLSKLSDGVMIMAYDFHKAKGTPGPNFPLKGRAKYGYDFEKMIDDFLKDVPREKLTIIFGMYGYSWQVNEKGESVMQGVAMSLNKIEQDFLARCLYVDCKIEEDSISKEKKILYTDQDNKKNVLWFEDVKSIEEKKKYLRSKGINSISFWAHSYY